MKAGRWLSSPGSGRAGNRLGRSGRRDRNNLFAFLTAEPNAVVAPIHPKAMPAILMTREEVEQWLTSPPNDALALQRPLPDDALSIVARGKKEDGPDGD
jgi:putative SOS response-associated peptidase YedK